VVEQPVAEQSEVNSSRLEHILSSHMVVDWVDGKVKR